MDIHDKIKEQIVQMEMTGLKASLLLAGDDVIAELTKSAQSIVGAFPKGIDLKYGKFNFAGTSLLIVPSNKKDDCIIYANSKYY